MRYMVRKWGWKDAEGRMSFRHTIRGGHSDRFKIIDDAKQIIVRPLQGNGPVPYWTHNDLLNIAAGKLRRLAIVKSERSGNTARFIQADCFETMDLDVFIDELTRGKVCIDFDCREATRGSGGLRNHGTKFRIAPDNICHLYHKKERFRV